MSHEMHNEYEGKSKGIGTGSISTTDYVKLVYLFERYEILVKLTSDGRFVGIEEVRVDKDFRSYKQVAPQKVFEYIDEYEPE